MRLINKSLLTTTLIALAAVMCVSAQDSRPRFEVASIKPSPNQYIGRPGLLYAVPGGRLTAEGITLRGLIFEAYDLSNADELSTAPEWIDRIRWDLDAQGAGNPSRQDMMVMLRSLLEDKFKLMVHREKRSGSFSTSVLVIDSMTKVSEN